MVFRCLAALYLLFLPPTTPAQEKQVQRLTLRECESLALQNSQLVKEAEMKVEFAEARRMQATHAGILPRLELKNEWGPISRARAQFNEFGVLMSPDTSFSFEDIRYYTEVQLDLLQPVFTFGKLSNTKKAARHGVQAERSGLEGKQQQTLLRIRELYWSLLLAQETLVVIEEAQSEIEKADDKIEEKLDAGSEDVSQTDQFKLQIFEYEINKRHRNTADDLALAEAELRMLTGIPDDTGIELATEYLDAVRVPIEEFEVYMDMAFKNRPELAQLQSGLVARQALVEVAKSDYYPQIFIGGQVKYNFAKDRFDSSNPFVYNRTNFFRPGIVLGMNMNLNFMQTRDKVRLQQAEYDALSGKQELLRGRIELEVAEAYLALKRAQKNMQESRRALRAGENWLRSATMTFDIGVGEVKELIDAFKAKSQMQAEHLQNIYKFNTALARLSKAVGRDLYPETDTKR